ncbi:hypothetical protein ACIBO2_08280 [Nonomuraea sp. NPDC050022]|uniref:hypothetical protein n=1 Tax=unclassified Nonomuraea TaxID=2593643 RepID=UPI0033F090E1
MAADPSAGGGSRSPSSSRKTLERPSSENCQAVTAVPPSPSAYGVAETNSRAHADTRSARLGGRIGRS